MAAVGAGAEPEAGERVDLGGALVTPGLVNTHHHLYQTLTRARAQEADLFSWLKALYPVWARLDEEAEYAAARTGLAELALSGCTTVFDHHYVFPRGAGDLIEAEMTAARELGVRLVRLARLDGPRRVGRRPAAGLARRGRGHGAGRDGAARCARDVTRELVVAPCSPFSVTGDLMARVGGARAPARTAAAHAPRRDGRGGGVLPRALRLQAGRVPGAGRLARRRRLVRALRPPRRTRRRRVSARPAPGSRTARPRTSASARGSRPCASCSTRRCASGSASTARPRTSGATSSSRSSRRCSSRAAAAGRRR